MPFHDDTGDTYLAAIIVAAAIAVNAVALAKPPAALAATPSLSYV